MTRQFDDPDSLALKTRSLRIGRDERGRWIVHDPAGQLGGMFTKQSEAIRFALRAPLRPRMCLIVQDIVRFDPGCAKPVDTVAADGPRHSAQARQSR
jgi:hypothetical protein